MANKDQTIYSAELRKDQWDLIVLALDHCRQMTTGGESQYAVDKLGRKFLRRCIDETNDCIAAQIPA